MEIDFDNIFRAVLDIKRGLLSLNDGKLQPEQIKLLRKNSDKVSELELDLRGLEFGIKNQKKENPQKGREEKGCG